MRKESLIYNLNYYLYFILIIALILIDRITKTLALANNLFYFSQFQRLFHLPAIKNPGVGLQIFNVNNPRTFFFLKSICIMILLYFVYQLIEKYKENKSMLGEALILSGGIGNLIDRFYYDAVIDFIFIKAPLVDFLAIANCADIFITVGSIIIIIELIYKK